MGCRHGRFEAPQVILDLLHPSDDDSGRNQLTTRFTGLAQHGGQRFCILDLSFACFAAEVLTIS